MNEYKESEGKSLEGQSDLSLTNSNNEEILIAFKERFHKGPDKEYRTVPPKWISKSGILPAEHKEGTLDNGDLKPLTPRTREEIIEALKQELRIQKATGRSQRLKSAYRRFNKDFDKELPKNDILDTPVDEIIFDHERPKPKPPEPKISPDELAKLINKEITAPRTITKIPVEAYRTIEMGDMSNLEPDLKEKTRLYRQKIIEEKANEALEINSLDIHFELEMTSQEFNDIPVKEDSSPRSPYTQARILSKEDRAEKINSEQEDKTIKVDHRNGIVTSMSNAPQSELAKGIKELSDAGLQIRAPKTSVFNQNEIHFEGKNIHIKMNPQAPRKSGLSAREKKVATLKTILESKKNEKKSIIEDLNTGGNNLTSSTKAVPKVKAEGFNKKPTINAFKPIMPTKPQAQKGKGMGHSK